MKKISTTIYLDEHQVDALDEIHDQTKVPVAVLIREAVDRVIAEYRLPARAVGQ